MIRLEIGLEIRYRGVMSLCAIEDKTAVVVVASYRRNPVRFKADFNHRVTATKFPRGSQS